MKVQGQWSDNNKCREFFCTYAELMKFDPMDPNQWEKIAPAQIRSKLVGSRLKYNKVLTILSIIMEILKKQGEGPFVRFKSLTRALREVFPELEFNFKGEPPHTLIISLILNTSLHPTAKAAPEYWRDSANCRQFFDSFAKAKGFDPLHAEHWYAQNLTDVINSVRSSI